MKSKVLLSLVLPVMLISLTGCNPTENTLTGSVLSGTVNEVKNLPALEEMEKEVESVDVMVEPEVAKKEEKVAKVVEATLAVEATQPQKKELVNVVKEVEAVEAKVVEEVKVAPVKVVPVKVEQVKVESVKVEPKKEVKTTPVLTSAPVVAQPVAVQPVEKPVVKTEKANKKEEKSVMLNPEETVIVNGSVVKKNANEDYRDLEEEAMIEAVLNSTSGFEGRDVEVSTPPAKVESVKVAPTKEEKVVENKSTLQQEEEQLDALLNAGKNNVEHTHSKDDVDCPIEDMGNGEYKVATTVIVNPVVEYDYSSLEE